jgi:integrase
MGRRSISGGVRAKGRDRIQFDFEFEGVRYRPTLARIPTEANLRRARKQLEGIKTRIAHGTFNFSEEFPDFRDLKEVSGPQAVRRTCNQVFDDFMAHCESRMAKNDLAYATVEGYRGTLDAHWRPEIGNYYFDDVKYSRLAKIVDSKRLIKKKTHNNIVSVVRCAFEYGYRDHPEKHNPASALKCFRLVKKDRKMPDPYTIHEAEALIAAIHRDWGEAQGNYDEFRFFTGLRPSEQIALRVDDCDLSQGKIMVNKARVMKRDKDRTKTGEDRIVELCPRALEVLKRHLALRARLKLQGKIDHEDLFFRDDGRPIVDLNHPYDRWRWTLRVTLKSRYREPYSARHSCVSWNLMLGKNLLWVAKQHGHSVQTMLDVYAAWIEGSKESDLEAIRQAMESSPRARARIASGGGVGGTGAASVPSRSTSSAEGPSVTDASRAAASLNQPPEFGTDLALEPRQTELTRRMRWTLYGGKGGTRFDPYLSA